MSEEFWTWLSRTSDLLQVGGAVAAVGSAATVYLWKRRRRLTRSAIDTLASLEKRGRYCWELGTRETKLTYDSLFASDVTPLELADCVFRAKFQTSQHLRPRQQRSKKNSFPGFLPVFRPIFAF